MNLTLYLCMESRSSCEKMATVLMESSWAVRHTRMAISYLGPSMWGKRSWHVWNAMDREKRETRYILTPRLTAISFLRLPITSLLRRMVSTECSRCGMAMYMCVCVCTNVKKCGEKKKEMWDYCTLDSNGFCSRREKEWRGRGRDRAPIYDFIWWHMEDVLFCHSDDAHHPSLFFTPPA